jgi:hypothetical protein
VIGLLKYCRIDPTSTTVPPARSVGIDETDDAFFVRDDMREILFIFGQLAAYRLTYFVLRAEPTFSIEPDFSIDAITASTVVGLTSGRI